MKRVLLAVATLLAAQPAFSEGESPVVEPSAEVAGKKQSEWSQIWWEWAGAFTRYSGPIADTTGEHCGDMQSGPVWFLAGTYGTKRTIRKCKVPKDVYLFFPLINYVIFPTKEPGPSCSEMTASVAEITSRPSALVLEIDGVRVDNLEQFRQATTSCFDFGARTKPHYSAYPSAANGYYAMLAPLSPGQHTINFGGALPSMLQAVTYYLEVE